MAVHHISRWVWLLLGLVLGLLFDQLERAPKASWSQAYGQSISQDEFEAGIQERLLIGRRFRNLVIYPERVRDIDGSSRDVHLVVGDYASRFEYRGQSPQPVWERRCFVAEAPYRPSAWQNGPAPSMPSVLSYLDGLRKTDSGLSYRYAWWRQPPWSTTFWAGCGVLVIGILWPTLIDLLTYGKLIRPRSKGIDLRKESAAPAPSEPVVSETDLQRAAELAEEIEAALRAQGAIEEPVTAPQPAAQPPKLDAGPLEPANVEAPPQLTEFAQDQDDFYPTERHARRPPAPPPEELGPDGFSLVELLLVVGLIALLIAFLMPTLAVAREHAKQIQCQAALHGIGQAAQLHVNEHQGYLPLCGWQFEPIGGTLDPAGVNDKAAQRYDYYVEDAVKRPLPITASLAISMGVRIRTDSREHVVQDLQLESVRRLFHCPSQDMPLEGGSMGDGRGWEAPREWCSYVFSEALLARRNHPWDFPVGHLSRVKQPQVVMFAIDGKPRGYFSVFDMTTHFTMYDFRDWVRHKPSDGPDVLDYTRHQFRANVLFCDWHVESIPLTEGGLRTIGISSGIYD